MPAGPEAGIGNAGAAREPEPPVSIRADIVHCVTFATHQADLPVLAELVISNPGPHDLDGLTLHLTTSPPLFDERVWKIDHITAGTEFLLPDRHRRIPIKGGLLDDLSERMRADIRLELRQPGEGGDESVLAVAEHSIEALARNEWGGYNHMPELLAAFVLPNDPAIARLLKRTAAVLSGEGKDPSLNGYLSKSPRRSWEILSGIWQATLSMGINYALPPASFETQGQKIRFPSVIEDEGLSTCLDTTLFFAAAIEQAGLYPVVVFTKGHALVGAWLQAQHLSTLTVDDPTELRKAIREKELVLFETTGATQAHPQSFSEALKTGRRQLSEYNEHDFIYAIDIHRARDRNIKPLSGIAAAPGTPGAETNAMATPVAQPSFEEAPDDIPATESRPGLDEEWQAKTPDERIDRWQRSLLDLTRRNRLLNLRQTNTALRLLCPDPAELEDRIAKKVHIKIVHFERGLGDNFNEQFVRESWRKDEVVAAGIEDRNRLLKSMTELYRKARNDFEEGGANTLFLALGMLRWVPAGEDKNRHARAPLILLPVRLHRRSARSIPKLIHHEDDPVFNLTLIQLLRQDFDIDLSEFEKELKPDESGIDVPYIWRKVRQKVKNVPHFEVVEEVVLSTFSFAKYLMWKDLTDRLSTLKESPFVRHLIDTPGAQYEAGASFLKPEEVDRKIPPTELMAPLNADSSQVVAIHASDSLGDFVLEGPPGTGKSETIANIIAHNLGKGRRVLFVSEKMAALDVVYRRLRDHGLGNFCLELHSAKAEKKAVLQQLDEAWEQRDKYSRGKWVSEAKQLGALREKLNGVVEALHRPGPVGMSPFQAMGRVLRYRDVHNLRLDDWGREASGNGWAPATHEAFEGLKKIAKQVGQRFHQIEPGDEDAFGVISSTEWSYAWQSRIVDEARELGAAIEALRRVRDAFIERIAPEMGTRVEPGNDLGETGALAQIAALVPECAELDLGFALDAEGRDTMQAVRSLADRVEAWRETHRTLPFETSDDDRRIMEAPVLRWKDEHAAAQAKIAPLRWFAHWRLRREMRDAFGVTRRALVPKPEQSLDSLATLQEIRSKMDRLEQSLPREGRTPWRGFATETAQVRREVDAGERLRAVVTQFAGFGGRAMGETRASFARLLGQDREKFEPGMPITEAAQEFRAAHSHFETCYARFQVVAQGGAALADSTVEAATSNAPAGLAADLDTLARSAALIVERSVRLVKWCRWTEISREADAKGLGSLLAALLDGQLRHEQAVDAFETAYACWAAPILLDERPELRRFAAVEHEALIREFRELDAEVAQLTASHIAACICAKSHVPPHDGGKVVHPGYKVLRHEIRKKTRHKPVRRLVTEMGSALASLTPCLMMSPLSVAQFLPTDSERFDLVVFDEASQITVPDAIGAIARGKQCIVVGDPKQMPPTNFFSRGAEEDENEDAVDLESILDQALAVWVPHHRLTGHYRSRHESLICFSNHAYYDGQLITYPSCSTRDSAVIFRRIDGVYAKGKSRTNQVEARAVVAEVVRRLRDPDLSRLSIGIVTLNSEQQRLVEDLLDDERRRDSSLEPFFVSAWDPDRQEQQKDAPTPVFVKNLETVQGDERDVILLSVGYGPTEIGGRTMSMNFGPLNREGGERRLNVAITRATTEVVVFASFDASMIDLTRTSATAVRDLKHYIDFAERGPVALGQRLETVGSEHDYDSDFEMMVAESLRKRGWKVRTQVGVSKFRIDLGILHPDDPDSFLAGVECDGAAYHSSPSARDRDRVRHQILVERFKWRLIRVWSTDFFRDPDSSVTRIDEALRVFLEEDRSGVESGTEEEAAETSAEDETPDEEGEAGEGRGFSRAESVARRPIEPNDEPREGDRPVPSPPSAASHALADSQVPNAGDAQEVPGGLDPDRFYDADYRPKLRAMAIYLIDVEGPIVFGRLAEQIARAHGFRRTGARIRDAVKRACGRARKAVNTPDGQKVFWPEGREPSSAIRFRGLSVNGGDPRSWDELPYPEKLGLIMETRTMDGDGDLARSVAGRIGMRRVTETFRSEVDALVEGLEKPPF